MARRLDHFGAVWCHIHLQQQHPSYPTRLWTIFEIAAFLRSHEDVTDKLIVRPTFLGPAAVAVFLFCSFLMLGVLFADFEDMESNFVMQLAFQFTIFAAAGHWLRSYYRQVEECHRQVRNFSLSGVKSYCCSMKHVDAAGNRMICDREIILECIRSWFGSDEEFEEAVRSQVSTALVKGVGYNALPYFWFVGVSVPILWGFIDLSAARFRAGATFNGMVVIIYTLIMWLGVGSCGFFSGQWISFQLRKRRAKLCCDLMVTLSGTGFMVANMLAVHVMQPVCQRAAGLLPGMLLWGLLTAACALLWHKLWLRATESAAKGKLPLQR